MTPAKSVCVFCGSSPGKQPEYMAAAESVGQAIAQRGWRLVYGGGAKGCMGAVSQAAVQSGADVIGIIPRTMTSSPPRGHSGGSTPAKSGAVSGEGTGATVLNPDAGQGRIETEVVESMHERKERMANLSDGGFIGLPGGFGTFEEILEMVTWNQIGIHLRPIVAVNIKGFFTPLRQQVERAVEDGFITAQNAELIAFVDAPSADCGEAVLAEIDRMQERLAQREGGFWDWKQSGGDAAMKDATLKSATDEPLAVDVPKLTFAFAQGQPPALKDCSVHLTRGSRCLLIGANGAGKSTLLRILAGKRLCETNVRVFGCDVFRNPPRGITYLGTEWAMNPVVRSDIVVSHFLDSVGGYRHKARRDRLLDILDVDLDWHMHAISDGERRRVQLCMGLMEPWDLLLLDEVTVDLDVQVRSDLLAFLTQETIQRNATIIYATHIFDGLQSFPTHVVHMRLGSTTTEDAIPYPPSKDQRHPGLPAVTSEDNDLSPLLNISLAWLREDRKVRQEEEQHRGKQRGARNADETTDSEKFFAKYDYSQTVMR